MLRGDCRLRGFERRCDELRDLTRRPQVELGRSAATGRWRDEDVAAFLATRQKLIECLTSGVKPAGGFLECRPHRGNLAFQWSSLEKALSDCGMAITAPADLNAASPDPALVMGLLSGPKPEGLPGGVVRVWNVVLETATGAAGLEDSACTVAAGMIAAGSVSFGELPKKLNCLIQVRWRCLPH